MKKLTIGNFTIFVVVLLLVAFTTPVVAEVEVDICEVEEEDGTVREVPCCDLTRSEQSSDICAEIADNLSGLENAINQVVINRLRQYSRQSIPPLVPDEIDTFRVILRPVVAQRLCCLCNPGLPYCVESISCVPPSDFFTCPTGFGSFFCTRCGDGCLANCRPE